MTDLKFHMIEKFYALDNRAIKEHELLNQYPGQRISAHYAMKELIANGILSFDNLLHALVLTEAGAIIFEEEQENRQKAVQAEERYQEEVKRYQSAEERYQKADALRKRDLVFTILALIAAYIPAVIQMVQFFMSLFSS